jgi:predicted kinase
MDQKMIVMCKGIQASGKSTFARKLVRENSDFVRVNNDDLRIMLCQRRFDRKDTKTIDQARNILEEMYLDNGKSIVSDNMNLGPKHETYYKQLAEKHKAKLIIKDFTDVSPNECIERDHKRGDLIGKGIIISTFYDMLKHKKFEPQNVNLPPAVWFDMDGTLSHVTNRSPYEEEKCRQDLPNWPIVTLAKQYKAAGYTLIVCSGRDYGKARNPTLEWLQFYRIFSPCTDIKNHYLFMRAAGDKRHDWIVKREIYERNIRDKYNLVCCFDDRSSVCHELRHLGLTVCQVNYGEF